MTANPTSRATPQFRVLSEDQIGRIFLASLEILERCGARVFCEGARQILAEAGASLQGDLARLPPGLVKQTLASVPPRIAVGDRDGRHAPPRQLPARG